MKKLRLTGLIAFAATVALTALTAGCNHDKEPEADGNHRHDRDKRATVYKMALSLGGDYVDQTEEPLSRAETSEKPYIGINVTRRDKNSRVDTGEEKYAFGVFTDRNNISIDLIGGYVYSFEATTVTDNTDRFNFSNSEANLRHPFHRKDGDGSTVGYPASEIGNFIYDYLPNGFPNGNTGAYLTELSSGKMDIISSDQDKTAAERLTMMYPRVHRYYGTAGDIDPEEIAKTKEPIRISLSYKCFGIKIDATEIPENTTVTWEDISDYPRTDSPDMHHLRFPAGLTLGKDGQHETQWEDIYSLKDLRSNDPVTFRLRFTWDKGYYEYKTFESDITVNPKTKTVLKIKIDGSANTGHTGNIILEEGSSDLDEVEQEVTKP